MGRKPRIVHKKGIFASSDYFVMPQSVVDDPRYPFKDGEELEFEIDEQGKKVIFKKKT